MATFRSGKDCLLSADGVRRHPPDEWWRKSERSLAYSCQPFKSERLILLTSRQCIMPTISISTREDENNRSMIQPPARTESGLTLRPISLGSLEVLRQLGNPLSTGNAELTNIGIGILTEFIWVHAAHMCPKVSWLIRRKPDEIWSCGNRTKTLYSARINSNIFKAFLCQTQRIIQPLH